MQPAIEVERLSRSFGSRERRVEALRDVSFSVDPGTVVAVLGTNGAGKTTLTKILSTLLLPSAGRARVVGFDVVDQARAIRPVTSAIFGGDRGLYQRLTGRANLRFFAMLAGVSRAELARRVPDVLAQVGLSDAADRRVETYSKGMRQRLHIAIGVISDPRVLLLDEPTVGLDPLEAQRLRLSIRQLRDGGTTILLTSHYLLDVEELADRVVLLNRGSTVGDMPLASFAAEAGYAAVIEVRGRGPAPQPGRLVNDIVRVDRLDSRDGEWTLVLRLPSWQSGTFQEVSEMLQTTEVVDVQVRPARLEEAYSRLASGGRR